MSSSSSKYVCVFVVCGKCIVFTYTSIYILHMHAYVYTLYRCIYMRTGARAYIQMHTVCIMCLYIYIYIYVCIMSVFLDLQMHEVQILNLLNQFSPVCTAYPNLHTKHM